MAEAVGKPGARPDLKRRLQRNAHPGGTGGIVQTQLPRDHAIKRLFLRLRVDLTQTGGAATVIADNPMSLVRSVTVAGTLPGKGRSVIKSASLTLFYWAAFFKRQTKPFRVQLASGGAQANTILECYVPLDFYATNLLDSGAGFLPAYLYRDLTLDINWGVATDLLSTGNVINSAFVDVVTHEIPGLTGNFAQNVETSMTFPVAATAVGQQVFDFPLSGYYKSLLFRTSQSTIAARSTVNTIITGDVTLELNGQYRARMMNWQELQGESAWMHGAGPSPIQTDAAGVRAIALGTEFNPQDGYAFVDFAQNAGIDGMIDARELSTFRMMADLTAVASTPLVECLVNRFEPPD